MGVDGFTLGADDLGAFGRGLSRPECVLAEADGIWASDARGGVARVAEGGSPVILGSGIVVPNGFTRHPDGSFFVSGLDDGKVHRVAPDGATSVVLDSIEGRPLGAVNHVWVDGRERIWVSVMTRHAKWYESMSDPKKDGYVILLEGTDARIVADGLDLANEVKVSPGGDYLYVAETLAARISRFAIRPDGQLGPRECFGPEHLGHGAYVDGFTFDADGNVWVTTVVRNGLVVIRPDGTAQTVFEDPQDDAVDAFVAAVERSTATSELIPPCVPAGPLKLPTSLAFGGPDGKTVYVGSLVLDHLVTFRSPVAGATWR